MKVRLKLRDLKKHFTLEQYYGKLDCIPIDERSILIESKKGVDLAGNMKAILKELKAPEYGNYQIYVTAKKHLHNKIQTLIEQTGTKNVQIVHMGSKKYYQILSKAKYLFFDTSSVMPYIKKPGQIIINTWHGTPLKKMGKYLPTKANPFGNVQRNLLMADYLVYPNERMRKIMFDAYYLDKAFKGKALMTGYPRNEIFFDAEKARADREKLKESAKKVFVYMPTWRGELVNIDSKSQIAEIQKRLLSLDKKLPKHIVIYAKMHPFIGDSLDYTDLKQIKKFPNQWDTYELLNASDGLITDYSSVFFDFANARKKIILWAYDEEEYIKERGLYENLSDLPFPVVKTESDLVRELDSEKQYDESAFMESYGYCDCANATKKLLHHVLLQEALQDGEIIDYATHNQKENVLIYVSTLAMNGMTTSLLSLMEHLDLNEKNYFAVYRETSKAKTAERLDILPKEVDCLPICSDEYTFSELVWFAMLHKLNLKWKCVERHVDQLFRREIRRLYPNWKIDYAIQFTGYESHIIHLFENMDAKRTIYVHNDMVKEVDVKGNQHRLTLQKAYRNYDHVAIVTEDLRASTKSFGTPDERIICVPNCHAHQTIVNKGKQEIVFQDYTECNISQDALIQKLQEPGVKFVNIGRFSPEKGQDMLIRAFERFADTHRDAKLVLIGGYGKSYEQIKTLAKDSRYADNIIIIRQINNPIPILKKCDLFVLSSHYEGFGLVLLEATSVGVPVVSTEIVGPTGFMKAHNGYLTEESEEGLLRAMNDYMEGKIKLLNVDFEKYNQTAVAQFEKLLV